MIRYISFVLCALLLVGCVQTSEKEAITPKETPHDFMFMQRAYPTGEIRTDAYAKAVAWKKELIQERSTAGIWEFVGPVNIGGRITDIEIPIDQAQTYFVGAASGGVFKTTDAGTTWTPIFDDQAMLSIGDIEISKNDTDVVWVGTGEVNAGGGSLAYDGDGIYKSEDGGLTWQTKGLPDVGSIGKILIDPNDDDTVFVGAMGPLFRDDTNRGVYRTTDGGTTWEQVLFVSDITGVIDMVNHPTDSNIIYAASWERVRRPEFRNYGGETSRIYRSTDGGDTWTELTTGLPSAAVDKGRISIDISQSNPNVLYTRYANASGSIQGVYRTSNGGDSWTEVDSSQLTNVGFHWWFRGIYVDPSDENTLYNVDFIVEKSTDGGQNWFTAFPNVHVDQHAMAFNASTGGEVLLGNDGGFYKSSDDGATAVKDLSLPITQFYRFHVDAQNPDRIYGGTQDNNTIRTITGNVDDWSSIYGGDGFQPLVDPTNSNVIYALSQNGNLGKSINDAANFNIVLDGIAPSDRNNWDTPIAFDPSNPQILYYGTQRVYKTTDGAANWNAISADLTNGSGGGNLTFGTIISIDVSILDSNLIYVGTDDGNVWVTEDGGNNWNNISSVLPNRWVTKVKADPIDSDKVYVTLSGYRYGEDQGHVYYSDNRGVDWIDITGNLPDIPVNDIEVAGNANELFLATDIGVMVASGPNGDWTIAGENMPSVPVTDLYYRFGTTGAQDFVYAATYGRSSYKMFVGVLNVGDFSSEENPLQLAPNPAIDKITISLAEWSDATEAVVYNQLGQVQATITLSNTKTQLDVTHFTSGTYYVQLRGGDRQYVKKFLKR